jgi:hypothetical protein
VIRRTGLLLARLCATAGLATTTAAALWPVSWGLDRVVEAYAGTPAPALWQHWATALRTATAEEVTIGTVNALAAAALFGAGWALIDRLRARLAAPAGDVEPAPLPPVPPVARSRRPAEVVI